MPRGRTALITVTIAGLATGCAHAPRPEVARATADLRCDDAASRVAARARTRALDELRRSGTTSLSVAATGAGWVTDVAIIGSVSVAAGGLVCAPLLALEVAAKSSGDASARCITEIGSRVIANAPLPGIGRGIERATHSWRCPDFVQLAREVGAVAGCYAARDAPGDRELAFETLAPLRWDREIWACLPGAEREAVDTIWLRLMEASPPPEQGPPGGGGAGRG